MLSCIWNSTPVSSLPLNFGNKTTLHNSSPPLKLDISLISFKSPGSDDEFPLNSKTQLFTSKLSISSHPYPLKIGTGDCFSFSNRKFPRSISWCTSLLLTKLSSSSMVILPSKRKKTLDIGAVFTQLAWSQTASEADILLSFPSR